MHIIIRIRINIIECGQWMIKGKVYELLHKYLGEYLFGFDRSKLDVAILSGIGEIQAVLGSINLKDVNVKPDKVNDHLARLRLPFALKAGMIGKLQLKYNLLSCLSNPFDVTVEDLQIILSPRVQFSPKEIFADEDDEIYNQDNCYNIFTHQIQFTCKEEGARKDEDEDSKTEMVKLIIKNVTLKINRIHIRYEDDYFASSNPFAFGFLCDQIYSYTTNNEWHFGSLESNKFTRALPRDPEGLIIRETNIINLRLYWKSMAEMYIPLSLLESTMYSENQIFDAISLEDLRSLMHQPFADENLVDPFSVYTTFTLNTRSSALEEALSGIRPKFKAELLFTRMNINLAPNVITDLGIFLECMESARISNEIAAYKPLRRPITGKDYCKESSARKYLRKMVARDWFFFAIWAARLKKIFKRAPEIFANREKRLEELRKSNALLTRFNKSRRERKPHVGERLETEHSGDSEDEIVAQQKEVYLAKMRQKIGEELAKSAKERQKKAMIFWGVTFTGRCQELSLKNPAWEIQLGKDKYISSKIIKEAKVLVYIKSLTGSHVQQSTANNRIAQCVLQVKPNNKSPAISLKITASTQHAERNATGVQADVGNITIDFSEKILEELCVMLSTYNQLYLLRDISPSRRIEEACRTPENEPVYEKDNLHFLVNDGFNETKAKSFFVPKDIVGKKMPKRIFSEIDAYLADRAFRFAFSASKLTVTLYESKEESGKASFIPFFCLTSPPTTISLQGTTEKIAMEVGGISISCTKSSSFTYLFWKGLKNTYGILTVSEHMKKYQERYDKLMQELRQKRKIKFDKEKAKELQSMETIIRFTEKHEEIKKKGQKLDDTIIVEHHTSPEKRPTEGKLWGVIRKQEMKVWMRSMRDMDEDLPYHHHNIPSPSPVLKVSHNHVAKVVNEVKHLKTIV